MSSKEKYLLLHKDVIPLAGLTDQSTACQFPCIVPVWDHLYPLKYFSGKQTWFHDECLTAKTNNFINKICNFNKKKNGCRTNKEEILPEVQYIKLQTFRTCNNNSYWFYFELLNFIVSSYNFQIKTKIVTYNLIYMLKIPDKWKQYNYGDHNLLTIKKNNS